MFQEPALFPWLTAGRNVELALRLRGVPRAERRAEAERLLDLVRLERRGQTSGCTSCPAACGSASRWPGRWPRTATVLLMDEPFAALDAITRDVLHDELTRVWARAAAVDRLRHAQRARGGPARPAGRAAVLPARPGRPRVERRHPAAADASSRPRSAALAAEITHDCARRSAAMARHCSAVTVREAEAQAADRRSAAVEAGLDALDDAAQLRRTPGRRRIVRAVGPAADRRPGPRSSGLAAGLHGRGQAGATRCPSPADVWETFLGDRGRSGRAGGDLDQPVPRRCRVPAVAGHRHAARPAGRPDPVVRAAIGPILTGCSRCRRWPGCRRRSSGSGSATR